MVVTRDAPASRARSSRLCEILSCLASLLGKGAPSSQAQPQETDAPPPALPWPRPHPCAGTTDPSTYW